MMVFEEPMESSLLSYIYKAQQGRLEVIANEIMEIQDLVKVRFFLKN